MDLKYIHTCFLKCKSVSIDTRKIEPDSLFIAIKGENFDANTFAKTAIEKGASFVIIDNKDYYIDEKTIVVEDSLKTLQELARFHRQYLKLPIIALTGSNGKTTTKELIQVVLSKKYNTKATKGNFNNHIGVPLTLLSFSNETEIGIVEMGANHQKEIEFLCNIAQPDYGYITNFGKAHLEGFGGYEGVIIGKSEMYQYLVKTKKEVFVNIDDPIQEEKTRSLTRHTFSHNRHLATVNIDKIEANPFVAISALGTEINSKLIGLYNANNINVAITIGNHFGVATSDIKDAIESYIPENNRSQLILQNTNTIILDAYNANPSSMDVAVQNLLQLLNPKKVAILGDMFELGSESIAEHKRIVDSLVVHPEVEVLFLGPDFYTQKKDNFKHLHFFNDFDALSKYILGRFEQSQILIKGSRGMALERTLDYL